MSDDLDPNPSEDPIRDRLYATAEDLDGDEDKATLEHVRTRLWLLNGAVICGVLLSATNADSVERWSASQPPNWATETVRLVADVWADRMALIGADEPKRVMDEEWEKLREAEWEEFEGVVEG